MRIYARRLLWLLLPLGLLGACTDAADRGHMGMDMGETMNHDTEMGAGSMNEVHGNQVEMKDTKGINEILIPTALESETSNNTVYSVRAQQGTTEIFEGVESDTYGYNGSFLGPMLRFKEGEDITIHLINELEEETTFHWHGLKVPADVDGGPHHTLVPGEKRTIKFTVQQEAAMLWFHPHPKGKTAEQVYKGLAGFIYIEDEKSNQTGLPQDYGVNDIPLLIQDRMFDNNRLLDYQDVKNSDGTVGDTVIINGTADPKLTVRKEKVRLRLVNGSNARNFTFRLKNGEQFIQIGTDGGLLNTPIRLNEVKLSPSERAEIIVDFSQMEETFLVDENGTELLKFELSNQPGSLTQVPDRMNDFEVTEEELDLPVSQKIELFGMMDMVTINGQQFDPERIDFKQQKGVTEIWEIYNKPDMMGGMIHPFHIHGTQFKIISRDGKTPPENERGWKDSLSIAPGEKVKIAVLFEDEGIFMFHCHILEHEDNGMMGQVEVY